MEKYLCMFQFLHGNTLNLRFFFGNPVWVMEIKFNIITFYRIREIQPQ